MGEDRQKNGEGGRGEDLTARERSSEVIKSRRCERERATETEYARWK